MNLGGRGIGASSFTPEASYGCPAAVLKLPDAHTVSISVPRPLIRPFEIIPASGWPLRFTKVTSRIRALDGGECRVCGAHMIRGSHLSRRANLHHATVIQP